MLGVDDAVATTRDAALALWRLLGSWASQAQQIIYRGTPEDPLLLLLPEQSLEVMAEVRWRTRMVDAAGAVEARGFPLGVEVEVHVALRDPELSDNDGRFVLSVSKGRPRRRVRRPRPLDARRVLARRRSRRAARRSRAKSDEVTSGRSPCRCPATSASSI